MNGHQHPPAPAAILEGPEHTNANGSRLLTAEDLAVRWQVQSSQVYRLTRSGRLPTVKLGRYYRYRLDVVEQFERAGGIAANA